MRNAHLRMGKLTFVRQGRDANTHVSAHVDRLVAEPPSDQRRETALHLVSVFGGDQEIGAVMGAAHEDLRFQIETDSRDLIGSFGEKPVVWRASLQVPGRKRPVRHAVIVSKTLFETSLGANGEARRTVLFDSSPEFVLHRLAVRFGLPALPKWACWFTAELARRGLIERLIGLNCAPIAVKSTKLRLLRILAQGLRRKTIEIAGLSQNQLSRARIGS